MSILTDAEYSDLTDLQESAMIDSCKLQRLRDGVDYNPHNREVEAHDRTLFWSSPCAYLPKTGEQTRTTKRGGVTLTTPAILLPLDTEVERGDRVIEIYDRVNRRREADTAFWKIKTLNRLTTCWYLEVEAVT